MRKILCLLFAALAAICAMGCDKPTDGFDARVTTVLQNYLASDAFTQARGNAVSAQARVPFLYLKYLQNTRYSQSDKTQLQELMSLLDEVTTDGVIDDDKFEGSALQERKWNSITDYLFTWSLLYNQYLQAGGDETTYAAHVAAVRDYVQTTDARLQSGATITVAWGYTAVDMLPIVAANLGSSQMPSYCRETLCAYYETTDGVFTREGGMANWNGFSGRALAASLLRTSERYNADFEKTRQGYFPIASDSAYLLQDMVTLDLLPENYRRTLPTAYEITLNPEYALLTALAHGIDMQNYRRAQPQNGDIDGQTFDLFAIWYGSLPVTDGMPVIDNPGDMAVAIAYLAYKKGVNAPTPLGLYTPNTAVLAL